MTPAEQTINRVLETGLVNADLSLIPSEQREAVILRLREVAQLKTGHALFGTGVVDPTDADLLLLRLGDDFTIQRMIGDYRAYDSLASFGYIPDTFKYSRQPKIIPYLAEDFSSQQDPNSTVRLQHPELYGDIGTGAPAPAIFSGEIVAKIIEKAPEFSAEMKAWAKQANALRLQSPRRFQDLMLAWWKVNKGAFERGEYGAVMPVAEPVAATPAPTRSTPTPTTPKPATPIPAPRPVAEATPIPPPTASTSVSISLWPWLVAGIAGLAVIAFISIKRRS